VRLRQDVGSWHLADLEAFGRECLLLGDSGHQARVFRCDAGGC
jgi:hypothetical protein